MMSEKFVEKRHINHPRSAVLLKNVSKRKLEKLQKWVSSHDRILVCPCHSSREIFLINETRRPRDPQPSAAQLRALSVIMKKGKAQSRNQAHQSSS